MIHEKIHLKEQFAFLGEDGRDPVLSLYLPDNSSDIFRQNKKLPCLIVCPGGGYSFISSREAEPIALNFLPEGYNVFVLEYSVAPNTFPAQLLEVAAVMELIYANAEQWSCDASKIAIMGFSAGGHLAGHYSTCYDCKEVRALFPESKPVQASVLCYPVITANSAYCHAASFKNLSGQEVLTPEIVEKFSLENRVRSTTPPTFLWHTADDGIVPVVNCLLYAQALAEKKVSFALRVYPKGGHGLATADEQTCSEESLVDVDAHQWIADATQWLKNVL